MKRSVILLLLAGIFSSRVEGRGIPVHHPERDTIITTDIIHFWQAFDLLKDQHSLSDSLHVIKINFIDKASIGLKEYIKAANCTANDFLEAIKKRRKDYLTIRSKINPVAAINDTMRQYLKKFRRLYPMLKVPVICFSIGKFEVGGSQFGNALYIGCEVDALHQVEIIPQAIHELAHFQQKFQDPVSNIDLAIIEGGAEFLCYQVTGTRTIPQVWAYSQIHEKSLWDEFKPVLDSSVSMKWFMDVFDSLNNRPGSLAYFIGFKICDAYIAQAADKTLAVQQICAMLKPKEIFAQSHYSP